MYVVKTATPRISDTLTHYPDPLFHFEDPPPPPQPIPGTASRSFPTADGSDLIGKWLNEPDEGVCEIISIAPPFLLQPATGNHNPAGPNLPPGYHYCLNYRRASGAIEFSSLQEIADWVEHFPFIPPPAILPPVIAPPVPAQPALPAAPAPPHPPPRRSARLNPPAQDGGDLLFSAGESAYLPTTDAFPSIPADFSQSHPESPLRAALSAGDATFVSPLLAYAADTPTLNLDHYGQPLRFSSALKGPNRDAWIEADIVELVKLVYGTGTLLPVHSPSQSPTYYNRIVKGKFKAGEVERRVRGTAGGDRISFPYSVSSSTASMTTFKCLLNAVVSSDSHLASADASDFYLGAPLPNPESMKIYTDTFDHATLDYLGFTPFIKTDSSGKHFVYCDILTTLYGLSCSGLLSHLRLLAQLYAYDYVQTSTPCLFRHRTRDVSFCLVVDDLAIKYTNTSDLQHLTTCLGELFHIKVYPTCTSFLGFTVEYDRPARTISLSYPSYIPDLLT